MSWEQSQIYALNARVTRLEKLVASIVNEERLIMVTLADIQAKADAELAQITAETDVVNAVKQVVDNQVAKLNDLQAQVAALLAQGTVNPADLQKLSDTIDAIKAADTSNAAIVSAAVAAGTPVAPTPAPAAPAAPSA